MILKTSSEHYINKEIFKDHVISMECYKVSALCSTSSPQWEDEVYSSQSLCAAFFSCSISSLGSPTSNSNDTELSPFVTSGLHQREDIDTSYDQPIRIFCCVQLLYSTALTDGERGGLFYLGNIFK